MDGALILCRLMQFAAAMLLWGAGSLRAGATSSTLHAFPPAARLMRLAAGLNLLAALGWLMVDAAMVSDGLQDAVNPDVVGALLSGTRFGQVWLVHLGLATALLVAALVGGPKALAVLAGLNLASLGLIGHAILPGGPLGVLHQALSVLHLLAAGFWVGGLVVILPLLRPGRLTEGAAHLLRQFSRWGHPAVAAVFATGLAKSLLILTAREGFDPAWDYLGLLLAKVAAVVLMLVLAVVNRYRFVPMLAMSDPTLALNALRRGTVAELALVGVVLGLVSLFATLSPFAGG